MAPTVNELSDRRRPYTLEEYLQTSLRLKDGVSVKSPDSFKFALSSVKARTAMGLVADDGRRRSGDSPSLPSSTSTLPYLTSDSFEDPRKYELVKISMKTMALLKRNHQLQKRLTAFQQETRAFVRSALEETSDLSPAPSELVD